jgi:hypothetical protein
MSPEPRGVVVPRGVLIGLVAALGIALLLAVFLLGRQSAAVAPAAANAPPPAAAAPAAEAPQTLAPPPTFAGFPPPTAAAPVPAATFPTLASAAAGPAPGVSESERAEVRRYFEESETIQARAKYWNDPQELAKGLLEQAAKGDPDAFKDLLDTQRKARDELARMSVPAACAEHHQRSVQALGGGLALLEKLQAALGRGTMDGLDEFPAQGRQLEAEARAIDELAKQIRQKYGV